MNRLHPSFVTVACLAAVGCASPDHSLENPESGTPVVLDWAAGQTFHLAASYRRAAVKSEIVPVDWAAAADGTADADFGADWTRDVIWTYQVVESGLVPDSTDSLRKFSETSRGVGSLAVLKASVEPALNEDAQVLDADPVVYMVFREDRDRMVGLIEYTTVNGERTERAYSASDLERSWSALSQSMLTKAPTYLAPYSTRWGHDTRRLENGAEITSVEVDAATTDVFYNDEMGGGLVVSRYEVGQPWPTWTTSDNVDVRMLSPEAVDERRFESGPMHLMPDVESFDYRAALQTAIDIDEALRVDLTEMESGAMKAEVPQQFKPWAGAWWSLREGLLVWGYDDRPTVSDEIRDEVDPIKKEMDSLSGEIRDMDDEAEGREAKIEAYQAKQEELVAVLKAFYNGLRDDVDGGRVIIADGAITKAATNDDGSEDDATQESGWSYAINDLSPMDKYAVTQYLLGHTHPNPFLISAWEILNSYNPGGEGWWGHCNGWAAAAILTHEPRESLTVEADGQVIEYTTADIKGLLTESHYGVYSQFYGSRYNDEEDDVTDLSPKAFHQLVAFFIGDLGVPMVFDTTATEAVWNFPAYGYELQVEETTDPEVSARLNINTGSADELAALDGVDAELAQRICDARFADGAFQELNDLLDVEGMTEALLAELADRITIDPNARSFSVTARVTFTTDNVNEEHIDGDEPEHFTDSWTYTLTTDQEGRVTGGEWQNEKDHPDFAWIPYHNTHRRENGGSENPFLAYGQLLDVVGSDVERH